MPRTAQAQTKRPSKVANSLPRSECMLRLLAKPIAITMHRADDVLTELATQLVDVNRNRIALDDGGAAVDQIFQLASADRLTLAFHQHDQGSELMHAQPNGFTASSDD